MNAFSLDVIDFNRNKKYYIFIVIEKIFIILLIYIMINDSAKILSGVHRIDKLEGANIYTNSDSTSNEKIERLSNDKDTIKRANKLIDYINKNFSNYSYWEYKSDNGYNGHDVFQASTNKYFFDLYSLNVINGRGFTVADEKTESGIKPVIVGYGLKDRYKLGETYTETDYNTGNEFKFKVIGILKRGASYPSLFILGEKYSLDYRYIKLIDTGSLDYFANIDMDLGSKVIFSKSQSDIKEIEKLSNENNLFNMNFSTVSATVNDYMANFIKGLYKTLIFILLLTVTVFILGVNRISMLIKSNYKNYLIRICCGASEQEIFISFMRQFLIIDLISSIPTFLYIAFNNGTYPVIVFALLFNALVNFLILKKVFRACSFENINSLIRRC